MTMIVTDLTALTTDTYRLQRVAVDSVPDTLLWMLGEGWVAPGARIGADLSAAKHALLDTAGRLWLTRLWFHEDHVARGGTSC